MRGIRAHPPLPRAADCRACHPPPFSRCTPDVTEAPATSTPTAVTAESRSPTQSPAPLSTPGDACEEDGDCASGTCKDSYSSGRRCCGGTGLERACMQCADDTGECERCELGTFLNADTGVCEGPLTTSPPTTTVITSRPTTAVITSPPTTMAPVPSETTLPARTAAATVESMTAVVPVTSASSATSALPQSSGRLTTLTTSQTSVPTTPTGGSDPASASETDGSDSNISAALIGGGVGAAAVSMAVLLIVCILRRRAKANRDTQALRHGRRLSSSTVSNPLHAISRPAVGIVEGSAGPAETRSSGDAHHHHDYAEIAPDYDHQHQNYARLESSHRVYASSHQNRPRLMGQPTPPDHRYAPLAPSHAVYDRDHQMAGHSSGTTYDQVEMVSSSSA